MSDADKLDIDEILKTKAIEVLHLQPQDVLVISFPGKLSDEQAIRIKESFMERLHPNIAIVVEGGVQFGVIRKSA